MEKIIEKVIEQIREDIRYGEIEALEELLSFLPKENLIAYLPEDNFDVDGD